MLGGQVLFQAQWPPWILSSENRSCSGCCWGIGLEGRRISSSLALVSKAVRASGSHVLGLWRMVWCARLNAKCLGLVSLFYAFFLPRSWSSIGVRYRGTGLDFLSFTVAWDSHSTTCWFFSHVCYSWVFSEPPSCPQVLVDYLQYMW